MNACFPLGTVLFLLAKLEYTMPCGPLPLLPGGSPPTAPLYTPCRRCASLSRALPSHKPAGAAGRPVCSCTPSSRKCRGQQKKRGKIWCVRKKPYLCTRKTKKAEIAQLVEHFIRNERVAGSSPAFGSRNSGISRETAIYNGLGSLAQLNRASDYGSEGYRFESYRSHKA